MEGRYKGRRKKRKVDQKNEKEQKRERVRGYRAENRGKRRNGGCSKPLDKFYI